MRQRQTTRGTALVTVLIVMTFMIALTAAYVTMSTQVQEKNIRDEYRYKARLAALSGIDRALIELNESIGATCSHYVAGSAPSCFGNIDGNVGDCRVLSSGSPVASAATNPDACALDAAIAGPDGWPDFKDETAQQPGVALTASEADGTYTVRSVGVGAPTGTATGGVAVYAAYHLRAYGVWRGEVVGLDVIARQDIQVSDNVSMFGKNYINGSGGALTNSWKSGYPPDPGSAFTTVTNYVAGNPNSGHGDVATPGNLVLSGGSVINGNAAYGGTYNGGGTITGSQTTTVPTPPPLNLPTPNNPTDLGTNLSSLSGSNVFALGTAQSPVSGDYTTSSINASGQSVIQVYPASGQTVRIFVTGNQVALSGTNQIQIFQPAPPALPGTVQLIVEGSNPNIQMSGQSHTDTLAGSAPATFQVLTNGAGTVSISGGGQLVGVIDAPNAKLNFSGGSGMKGMVIGASVDISGTSTFEYDVSLNNLNPSQTPIFRIFALVEVAARTR